MEYQKFEDYLQHSCFEQNPQVLDDDMADFYDSWVSELEVPEVIIYAEGWMAKTKSDIRSFVHNITK